MEDSIKDSEWEQYTDWFSKKITLMTNPGKYVEHHFLYVLLEEERGKIFFFSKQ